MNTIIVLIPHYNSPEGLIKSLESINKTENVDVVIVDDGSIEKKFNESDVKGAFKANGDIHFIYLPKNLGIEHALNKGLEFINTQEQYKYVARLDCGDICIGNRFAIQEKYMKEHPDVKLLGSNVIAVDMKGKKLFNNVLPANDKDLKKKMYLNCLFIHPTVMFSKEVIDEIGFYPLKYPSAEDYGYFIAITRKYKVANLQQFLVQYEVNPNGISMQKRKQQVASRIKVIWDNFYFGFYPIYGLLRSFVLYFMPNKLLLYVKSKVKK
ncbi:hypothetical protein GCM10007424_16940 [Flavobacterium suaedae]|uniref:Glycosyltransferase 2-like domain-containing protein n=1 Tax=Flavobacterium suaedae TaxID=1767027 RepID=A0ABQ1JV70_9FLAO|nr:glycosyltransferase [Flavobacterium suaedae]GGB77489.1 hypothetical protein GCM10007424_16940 [Flavobacterium suaedae]